MSQPDKQDGPNKIKHLIGVMSGKGGVGKSTVTYLTALALKQKDYKVGILDADITGASIPRMMHLPKYEMKVAGV
ncbi:MAG TPA: sodium:proton antiporter, partial [Acidobacteria bacterium]|nr:sodium:proton antiporter [Acidobacteriota bacterium]